MRTELRQKLDRTSHRLDQNTVVAEEPVGIPDDSAGARAMEFDAGQQVELYHDGRWRSARVERVKTATLIVREVGSNTVYHVRVARVRA